MYLGGRKPFYLKKQREVACVTKRGRFRRQKKKSVFLPVATGRTNMVENLITGEWHNLFP